MQLNTDTWNALLGLVIAGVGLLIRRSIKTPRDSERALLLAALANDAAAVVVNLTPTATWAQMVRDIVARLASESTVPTSNRSKLETAATAALVRLGRTDNGK